MAMHIYIYRVKIKIYTHREQKNDKYEDPHFFVLLVNNLQRDTIDNNMYYNIVYIYIDRKRREDEYNIYIYIYRYIIIQFKTTAKLIY